MPLKIFPIHKFTDAHGLLDKIFQPDGGDTCQREGMFWLLKRILKHHIETLKYPRDVSPYQVFTKLHVAPGVLVRHCNPDIDASDWDRMTPDQLRPMIAAMAVWDRKQFWRFFKGHALRGFVFANNVRRNGATKRNHGKRVAGEIRNYNWKLPDITGPAVWASLIRGANLWPLWPLLLLFDCFHLGSAIKWRYFPKHNIVLNHGVDSVWFSYKYSTPVVWLSRKVMPPSKICAIVADHFDDFGKGNDMQFFAEMFEDAFKILEIWDKK